MKEDRMCANCKHWKSTHNRQYCKYCDNILERETTNIEKAISNILLKANFPDNIIENKFYLSLNTKIGVFDVCKYYEKTNKQNQGK